MQHPSTRIWCFAYSHNGADPLIWKPGNPIPECFQQPGLFIAHNIGFERAVWQFILTPRFGFPPLPPVEQWFCTMAAAQMSALPAALNKVADVLQLKHRKLDNDPMKLLSKPRKARKNEDLNQLHWYDSPENIASLCDYCLGDLRCEMDLHQWLRQHWDPLSSSTIIKSPNAPTSAVSLSTGISPLSP
jgi:DNA polymerase